MGYVLPRGSSRYVARVRTTDGVKPLPKGHTVRLPEPVKIPLPPAQVPAQSTQTSNRER